MVTIPPRLVKVIVGPRVGGVAREWADLFMTFKVSASTGKTPNKAAVEIYNLNAASLQWLEQPEQTLQVLAGETIPSSIFFGDLLTGKVRTKRSGADYITTLEAQDGKRVLQLGYFVGSYGAGTTRSQILTDALSANGITVGYVHPLPERIYEAGASYSEPLESVLDDLYAGEVATWSIQDGRFQLVGLGQPVPGTAPIISAQTGMIGSPERTDKGVKVSVDLAPALKPGGGFVVQSRFWSGSARITALDHVGDREGKKWQTDLVGVPLAA